MRNSWELAEELLRTSWGIGKNLGEFRHTKSLILDNRNYFKQGRFGTKHMGKAEIESGKVNIISRNYADLNLGSTNIESKLKISFQC